jgi:aldehyde dehydrogenase (NAD+)
LKPLQKSIAIMSLTQKIETPSITYEQPIGLYIDGKWVKGKEGKTFETINPSDEKPIVAVHEAGPDGMDLYPGSPRTRHGLN